MSKILWKESASLTFKLILLFFLNGILCFLSCMPHDEPKIFQENQTWEKCTKEY
jgi:hypothetical protein